MKILIAEDLKVPRIVLEMALQKLGHEFVTTPDGAQAWEAFQKDDFPVIVTDWQMPNMDGLELCRRVRALPRERYTYVIVLTTLDTRADYMKAIEAGTDDFLNKPLEEDALAARLCVAERIGGMLTQMQQLQGLLPICPTCKKVCDGDDHWVGMEEYVARHAQATVTASRCPPCDAKRQELDRSLRHDLGRLRQTFRKTS